VIPLFYERDKHGIPRKWIARMRNAMRSIIPRYNTHRMVAEYAGEMYFPALRARLREPEKKVSAR